MSALIITSTEQSIGTLSLIGAATDYRSETIRRVHEALDHVAEILVAADLDQLGRDLIKRSRSYMLSQHLGDLQRGRTDNGLNGFPGLSAHKRLAPGQLPRSEHRSEIISQRVGSPIAALRTRYRRGRGSPSTEQHYSRPPAGDSGRFRK